MSDGDDDQPPQPRRQRQRSRSHERSYSHAQVPEGPQVQPTIIQELVTDPDEDPTVVNPSLSTGLSPPVEQRDRSRRQQRSRARERTPQRTPPHTPSQSGQQPRHVVLSPGESQAQPLASQDTDEESETVEPQSRVSNRSTLLEENPQNQKGKKTKAEVEKPNDPPIAKKHKSMDADEDDLKMNQELLQTLSLFYLPTCCTSATFESRTSSLFTGTSCQRQL